MNDRNLSMATCLIILLLFGYGFDFTTHITEQIALLIAGTLFGNLFTVADYAGNTDD